MSWSMEQWKQCYGLMSQTLKYLDPHTFAEAARNNQPTVKRGGGSVMAHTGDLGGTKVSDLMEVKIDLRKSDIIERSSLSCRSTWSQILK